jgi:hypothetical protein
MAGTTAANLAELLCELRQAHSGASETDLAYVDPRKAQVPDAPPADRSWGGFPRVVLEPLAHDDHERAWEIAETIDTSDPDARGPSPVIAYEFADGTPVDLPARIMQDEYLEWRATQDEHGTSAVALTCEGPEYWTELARHDPNLVHKRYEELLGHSVPKEDLFFEQDVLVVGGSKPELAFEADEYNPHNHWNTRDGIIHLTQENNTLGAEVNLAVRASVPRLDVNDEEIDEPAPLACCTGFGDPNRDSDPNIGLVANRAARAGQRLTLTDPIGLYIAEFDTTGIAVRSDVDAELPAGTKPPSEWWDPVRGEEKSADGQSRILRIVFEVPAGAKVNDGDGGRPLRVEDLAIDGVPIARAGALAELVTMHLMVTAWSDPTSKPLSLHCQSTCCPGEGGALHTCPGGPDAVFSNLVDSQRRARPCPREDRKELRRKAYEKAHGEALAEFASHRGDVELARALDGAAPTRHRARRAR